MIKAVLINNSVICKADLVKQTEAKMGQSSALGKTNIEKISLQKFHRFVTRPRLT